MDKFKINEALIKRDEILCYKRLIRNLRVRKNEKSNIKVINYNIANNEKSENS